MNKGIKALTDNWATWKKTLSTTNKVSADYLDTIQELRIVLKDLTGVVDEKFIPKDFFDVPENLELMEKAAKGDVQAINLLGTALAQSTIQSKEFVEGMSVGLEAFIKNTPFESFNPFTSAEDAFNYYRDNVLEGITALNDAIKASTVKAGADITELMDG